MTVTLGEKVSFKFRDIERSFWPPDEMNMSGFALVHPAAQHVGSVVPQQKPG